MKSDSGVTSTRASTSQAVIGDRSPGNTARGEFVTRLTEDVLSKALSYPGQQISATPMFEGDWHATNDVYLTNRSDFAPFTTVMILWDKETGRIKGIQLQLSVEGRPSDEADPYFTAVEALTKRFGPDDNQSVKASYLSKNEAEWQLARKGVFLKRIPHTDGQRETVDYELGVVGNWVDIIPKPIDGAFGFTLGATMPQELVRAGQRKKDGVLVGVRALRPHPLLSAYALSLTPQSSKIYGIYGWFKGNGGKAAEAFMSILKEARGNYDWDSCEFKISGPGETVTLEKGDRSIVVAFQAGQTSGHLNEWEPVGPSSASIQFVDGKQIDSAIMESTGF